MSILTILEDVQWDIRARYLKPGPADRAPETGLT